jgi:2-keto-4-pentenoate hydratase/2-oxohepta-3-ene-1,7-dioic acid hydratase in catechol pathway
MKLLTVEHQGRQTAAVLIDDHMVLLNDDMRSVLAEAPAGYARLRARLESGSPERVPLADVRVLAPVPDSRKIFCLAGNYADHILEGGGNVDEPKTIPDVFIKPVTTIRAAGDPIELPKIGRQLDWELELAIVIGRRGKYIAAAQAHEHIAGFMAFNDVSERDLVVWDESEATDKSARRAFFRWLNGKWMDGSAITGPWLVTPDETGDPHQLALRLELNGETMQEGNTGQMLLQVPQIVEFVSHLATLEPGDIIATGTPAGVGSARNRFLKPGDEIRAEIAGLGVQQNIVAPEPDGA